MDSLLKRIKVFLITFITLLSVLTIFGIYSPLSQTIEKEKRSHFITAAEIYHDSIESFISNAFQDVHVIASDYDTKTRLIDYWEGNQTKAEITAYFDVAFKEHLEIYEGVLYAEIGANNEFLSSYGTSVETYPYSEIIMNFYGHKLIKTDTKDILRITYPVTLNVTNVGYVVVYFELEPILTSHQHLSLSLYPNNSELQEIYLNSKQIKVDNTTLYLHDDHVDYIGVFPGNQIFYVISINNTDLYGNSNSIVKYSIIALILIIFIAFTIFNTAVFKKAQQLVISTNIEKEEILQIADVDSLTGAYSRSYFDRYAKTFNRRYDSSWIASLVMIDFDDLKTINDTHGHLAGDTVLKTVVQMVNESLRANDLCFRFGGDEFIIILEDCDLELAHKIANRLMNDIQNVSNALPYTVSISFGIAKLSNNSDINAVIHEADQNMYKDKKQKDQRNYDLFNV
ncbi:GGDEF domain-containing protein [Acholeplasma vituli]|uniref:GGDEF domain-containing protein n=1 Tax=Paracholeplasma vituli TaxID=69473 RepID=A0ABT2PXR7_9MOLU|nr:GGDEF domain-containing protein [Paracholeplasma vituli]MCU0105256.1 GGDEF domain-containing protein [Paracholeplasma vituli]